MNKLLFKGIGVLIISYALVISILDLNYLSIGYPFFWYIKFISGYILLSFIGIYLIIVGR